MIPVNILTTLTKKEKETPPKETVKTQPTISRGGLEDVLNSDTFYRRKRGLDF